MLDTRRSLGAALVAALLIIGLAPVAFAAPEDTFLAKLNGERSARGLNELSSHFDLVDDAEAHSRRMRDEDRLHHNPNLGNVTTGWIALGENVGVGPSADAIHEAFMNSSGHRGNILGDFTHVGIGAVRESDNKLWVTVIFMKAKSGDSSTTTAAPPTTTAPPPTTAPPGSTTPPRSPTSTAVPQPPTSEAPALPSRIESASADRDVTPIEHVIRLHQPRPV